MFKNKDTLTFTYAETKMEKKKKKVHPICKLTSKGCWSDGQEPQEAGVLNLIPTLPQRVTPHTVIQ